MNRYEHLYVYLFLIHFPYTYSTRIDCLSLKKNCKFIFYKFCFVLFGTIFLLFFFSFPISQSISTKSTHRRCIVSGSIPWINSTRL